MAVFTKSLKKHIFVHPALQTKLHSAVKSALLKDKRKFSDRLEGALLDVSKLQVIGDRHLIVDGFLSMEVEAEFHVFCPAVGMKLNGIINKISKSHVGCLVMELFNASLAVSPHNPVTLQLGDACEFYVTDIIIDGDILSLRGSLSEEYSELQDDLEQEKKKVETKSDKADGQTNEELFARGVLTQSSTTISKSPKKSKKIKEEPIDNDYESIAFDANGSGERGSQKKKKKMKEKSDMDISHPVSVKKELFLSPKKELTPSHSHDNKSPSKKKNLKKEPSDF